MSDSRDTKVHVLPADGIADGGGATDSHDNIFGEPRDSIADFAFDASTVAVFDDMAVRSIPFYEEIQRMVGELAAAFAEPGTTLYDLGCATGTTLAVLDPVVDPGVRFVGVDNSREMLERARAKFAGLASEREVEFIESDLHEGPVIEDASVVILLLTLQFMRPLYRERFLGRIYAGMRHNACLVLVEKLSCPSTLLNRSFIRFYYDFKRRNGYSDMEIAQKREALENVLIPYRFEENRELLSRVSFENIEEFFRWYNFSALVAVK